MSISAEDLAKQLIHDHRNPIVKVDLPGSKLFLKCFSQEECEYVEKHQNKLENMLSHVRAERRCARALATWFPDIKLAKLTKIVKTLNHFGYQNKNGTFIYPEEALYLMETNRLEVILNGKPLSIQEGYDLLLENDDCDIIKYRVYKKLVLQGYKVLRYSELHRRLLKVTKCNTSEKEIKNSDSEQNIEDEFKSKKRKLDPESDLRLEPESLGNSSNLNATQLECVTKIFEKLRSNAPREYNSTASSHENPDYCVFLPTNKTRCDYDINLYICRDFILEKGNHNMVKPAIFAVCSEGNISFYKFAHVHLPFL